MKRWVKQTASNLASATSGVVGGPVMPDDVEAYCRELEGTAASLRLLAEDVGPHVTARERLAVSMRMAEVVMRHGRASQAFARRMQGESLVDGAKMALGK